jgi:hypothetical protein
MEIQARYDEDGSQHTRRTVRAFQLGFPFLKSGREAGLCTVQTKVSETENSRSVCDDGDVQIVGRISLKDFVDVAFVFQAEMETFRINVDV